MAKICEIMKDEYKSKKEILSLINIGLVSSRSTKNLWKQIIPILKNAIDKVERPYPSSIKNKPSS